LPRSIWWVVASIAIVAWVMYSLSAMPVVDEAWIRIGIDTGPRRLGRPVVEFGEVRVAVGDRLVAEPSLSCIGGQPDEHSHQGVPVRRVAFILVSRSARWGQWLGRLLPDRVEVLEITGETRAVGDQVWWRAVSRAPN
jgi:hypothetical protein